MERETPSSGEAAASAEAGGPGAAPGSAPPGPAKRALMAIAVVLFLVCSVIAQLPRSTPPLSQLGLFWRWDMFAETPGRSFLIAMGTPRGAAAAAQGAVRSEDMVVLDDPLDRDRPWLDLMRDARQRKLHKGMERILRLDARQSYLAYLCRVHGDRVSSVALVHRDPTGALAPPVAVLSCDGR